MASKRRKMFQKNKTQEATENACSSSAVMGLISAWSSPALAKLGSRLSGQELITVHAALPAGASIGVVLGWLAVEYYGPRVVLLLGGVCSLVCWILLGVDSDTAFLIAGRLVGGLAAGVLNISSALYIPEIVTTELRGVVFSIANVFTNLGYLIEYGVGPFIELPLLAAVSSVIPILYTLLCFLLPESPQFLVSKGRIEKAEKQLAKLRSKGVVAYELKALEETCVIDNKKGPVSRWFSEMKSAKRHHLRMLSIVCGACLLKQVTGGLAVLSYAQPIFLHSKVAVSSEVASLIVGAVKTLGSCFTAILAKKFSLKTLLIVSSSGVAFFLLSLAAYLFFYESSGVTYSYLEWIPLFCMTLYFVFLDFGIGPFPSYLGSEVLDWKVRGGGVAIALCLTHVTNTITMAMVVSWYLPLALAVFGGSALAAVPFLYVCLPSKKVETPPPEGEPAQEEVFVITRM